MKRNFGMPSADNNAKHVVIVQRRLTHYRVPFFEELRRALAVRDIKLTLVYGNPTRREASKDDGADLPWGIKVPCKYFLSDRLCLQWFVPQAKNADLVILTHENKLIANLWAQYAMSNLRVGLWGHGANLQGSKNSIREIFKRRTALRADWWFGYTEMSRGLILSTGYPADRISIVENSIDSLALATEYTAALDAKLNNAISTEMACEAPTAAYIGSLYKEKRLEFLFEAAVRIKDIIPEFRLIVAGAGPDKEIVESFVGRNPWVRYVGPVDDQNKALILAESKVLLNPGLVGLGILDSFVCQTPMITTDCGIHSPEISYLANGENGVMTNDDIHSFVREAVSVLQDAKYRNHLVNGCKKSALHYTVENMAANFADGIISCLNSAPLRSQK
ncbi:glycosyltransferase family 4 protein [Stenotrophomonas sp. C-A]